MPTNQNMHTTTRINHPINIFYQSKVLLRVIDAFIYVRFGKKDSMPQHTGDTNKWRRWGNPDAQTVPLTEGVDPSPILLSKTDIQVRMKEYGAWIVTSSWMTFTGITDDQNQMSENSFAWVESAPKALSKTTRVSRCHLSKLGLTLAYRNDGNRLSWPCTSFSAVDLFMFVLPT